jgi:hypothetical protein
VRLILWPMAVNSFANRRVPLQVQRSGDLGSPRSVGSTSASRSPNKDGEAETNFFRPPPWRRTRGASTAAADPLSSFRPRPIVLTAIPVARATAAIPP